MPDEFSSRKTRWKPTPRPDWVARINREGECMDIKSVVPLDENSLLAHAQANTGLTDFGEDSWYEPFRVLIRSLDEEARLNLMGRLMTRSDLLIYLEGRLRIEDTLKRHPEILEEEIRKPLFVVGQGRSGTTFMQNVLSQPPENGTTKTWETLFPCPPPEADTYETDPRISKADRLTGQLNRVVPELAPMYEYVGHKSTEIVQLMCLAFISPNWFPIFGGQVQSYMEYVNKLDVTPVYEYQERVLKLLQWKKPREHWILKSPAALLHMPQILKVHPDAGFVWNHRDPIKALSSAVNLAGTLFWSRSDHPFCDGTMDMFTSADLSAFLLTQPIQWLDENTVPRERICNIQFLDFVKDPLATVAHIHDYFDMNFSRQGAQAVSRYLEENPRSSRPAHSYSVGDDTQVSSERQVYKRYQTYFDVPSEI
jgi:Sulfotransferase family